MSVTKYACIKVKIPVSIAALYRVDMFPVTDYKTCTQKLNKKSKAALGRVSKRAVGGNSVNKTNSCRQRLSEKKFKKLL